MVNNALNKACRHFVVLKYILQQILHLKHPGEFFKYPAELVVFAASHTEVQNIAVKGFLHGIWGHVLNFTAGRMENNPVEFSDFRIDLYVHFINRHFLFLLKREQS